MKSAGPDDGRCVVVTGAGRGIGRAIAQAFAEAGARVVVADLDRATAADAAASIRDLGAEAIAVGVNVCDEASVTKLFEAVNEWAGAVQVLVNNAGMTIQKPAMDLSLDEWMRVLNVNLTGTFLCARAAAAEMMSAGKGGTIVNLSSINGIVAPAFHPSSPYAAAKAGVLGLTRALAVEWARSGIRVNAVCPTYVRTEMTAARLADETYSGSIIARTPMGRIAEPSDMTGAVMFLASQGASMITGQALAVDGGWTIV